jgi:hypothetical protein
MSSPARAFDENGFSSGMTIETVRRVLAERREILKPLDNSNTRGTARGGQSFMITSGLPGANPTGSLSFCNGTLAHYSLNINGEFPAFERLAAQRTAELGQAFYTTQDAQTAMGPFYMFRLFWSRAGAYEELTINQIGGQTPDVSRSFGSILTECDPPKKQ